MKDTLTFALIHSPLVGPFTWKLVHSEFETRGIDALTPTLLDDPGDARPFWLQHAESAVESLLQIPHFRKIILVGHSGAGPLLPMIRQLMPHPISAYMFVDAGIPRNNSSRIDLMRLQDQQWAEKFYQSLQQGAQFPAWSEDDLQEAIPDAGFRTKMIAELNPRTLQFFTEPIPVFSSWPDAPCAYLKFSATYDWDFNQAREAHWLLREINAGHFHMLVDPLAVTNLIIDAVHELGNHQSQV